MVPIGQVSIASAHLTTHNFMGLGGVYDMCIYITAITIMYNVYDIDVLFRRMCLLLTRKLKLVIRKHSLI